MRSFVYSELTSSERRGQEYNLGKAIPLNGSVLSGDGRCFAATCSFPRKSSGFEYAECGITFLQIRLDLPRKWKSARQSHVARYHPSHALLL